MSRGIGAYAHKIAEDENSVVYEYGGYNLNDPKYHNDNHLCDGNIAVLKECFAEPEIHEKMKKTPSGKKQQVKKRIPVDVDYEQMLHNGLIKVENCSNCWRTTDDDLNVDVMVLHLLFKLFREYQVESKIPESVSYDA